MLFLRAYKTVANLSDFLVGKSIYYYEEQILIKNNAKNLTQDRKMKLLYNTLDTNNCWKQEFPVLEIPLQDQRLPNSGPTREGNTERLPVKLPLLINSGIKLNY